MWLIRLKWQTLVHRIHLGEPRRIATTVVGGYFGSITQLRVSPDYLIWEFYTGLVCVNDDESEDLRQWL
jgi:hypothetical protein